MSTPACIASLTVAGALAFAAIGSVHDVEVSGVDLGSLRFQWGSNAPLTGSDLNNDGIVNGADSGILLSVLGRCP